MEDNSADVLLIRESLRTSSIAADVTIAYDGEEADRLLSEPDFKAALILLDLNIPKLDVFRFWNGTPRMFHPWSSLPALQTQPIRPAHWI